MKAEGAHTAHKFRLKPMQILILGFAAVILIGGLLLNTPWAAADGKSVGLLNAMFTSVSAVCVTGLTVVQVNVTYSLFGKIVLMCLIQVGGLGFMTFATFIFTFTRRRITLRERLIIQNALNEDNLQGMVMAVRRIIFTTFVIETIGAGLLAIRFIPIVGVARGIFYGIFHSISAFCNAGFDIIGPVSLEPFVGDALVCGTIIALIVCGGLGFAVLNDVWRNARTKTLSLHTKVVLITTVILIVGGTALVLIFEAGNPNTMGNLPFGTKVLASAFQSVTTRTAGFSSVSQAALTSPVKIISMILMFIGASPASTGGGLKTSTMALAVMYVIAVVRGRREVVVNKRSVSDLTVARAISIIIISMTIIVLLVLGITSLEQNNLGRGTITVEHIAFEVFSAFGTVGLSASLTPILRPASKILLMLAMFIGRLGPLTMTYAIASSAKEANTTVHYTEGKIMVG